MLHDVLSDSVKDNAALIGDAPFLFEVVLNPCDLVDATRKQMISVYTNNVHGDKECRYKVWAQISSLARWRHIQHMSDSQFTQEPTILCMWLCSKINAMAMTMLNYASRNRVAHFPGQGCQDPN